MSPYSIHIALALAGEGAAGNTFEEIKNTLHLTGDKDSIAKSFSDSFASVQSRKGDSTLDIANKVFVKKGYQIAPKFADYAVKSFGSEVQALDFAQNVDSANTINQWVEQKTNEKIKDLIKADSLDSDTRMVLVNAIYFKGQWEHQFNKNRTEKAPFWLDQTRSIDVDMMHAKQSYEYGKIDELAATALELKYKDSDISFLILLPNERNGLKEMEGKLTSINLEAIKGKMYSEEVELTLPRFKIEHEIDLKEILSQVWMQRSNQLMALVLNFD